MNLNPLEQLNLITMAAIAAIFLVTFALLRNLFFTPLIDVMQKRAGKLERANARYREADALIEKAREEAARIAAGAAEAAARLSEEVGEEIARVRESRRAEAGAEAEKIIANGRLEIARLKTAEQTRLKEDLLQCCKQTLNKMIPEVDEQTLRLMVNRVLTARGAPKEP